MPDTYIPPGPVPPAIPGVVAMGRSGSRQWSGYGTADVVPQIVVDDADYYVRDSMAVYAFAPPPTLRRLEQVVGTMWVRTTMTPVRAHGWVSVEAELDNSMERLTDSAIDRARVAARNDRDSVVAVVCAGVLWEINTNTLAWSTEGLHELRAVSMSYDDGVQVPAVPGPEELLDAQAIAGPLGLHRVPRKAHPYSADITPPEDAEGLWSVTHAGLADLLHVEGCVDAERLVQAEVRRAQPRLELRVAYDSEGSLFAAYSHARADAVALRKLIDTMIEASGPSASRHDSHNAP